MTTYLIAVRDAASRVRSAIDMSPSDPKAASARAEAVTALSDISDTATRIVASFVPQIPNRDDVVWLDHEDNRGIDPRRDAGGAAVGGRSVARQAVRPVHRGADVGHADRRRILRRDGRGMGIDDGDDEPQQWRGIDVGSPFEHAKSGILYVAAHLPAAGPRRHRLRRAARRRSQTLIDAAGGRTLGLFSSMRAARAAAEVMRERLSTPVLCQGDDTTSALVKQFADDPSTSLFGTLSLWQGVDVPGPSLSLVLIDRIPFPRPDDPLLSARQRAVAARGGNGFMAVAASHAALLLAQGAGRLLRRTEDRGVVAVLDSRMATARYGGYLRASLPPFWATTDPVRVRQALERLHTANAALS